MTTRANFTLDGTLATLPMNTPEPFEEKQAESDPRVVAYIEAHRAGDHGTMVALRTEHADNPAIQCRFTTIDLISLRTMLRYEAEIKVLRQEARGWELLSDGYEALNGDDPECDRDQARLWIRQGLRSLERASLGRKDLEGDLGI